MDGITRRVAGVALLAAASLTLHAGVSPVQVLVVVNDQNPESIELGRHYAAVHGIPGAQVLHLSLPVVDEISAPAFTNLVHQPLTQYLAATGLEPQIRQIAFCWNRPFRVYSNGANANSLASVMFYGYRDAPPPGNCELNPAAFNPLFASGRRFLPSEHTTRLYPSFMVTAGSLSSAKAMIDRSRLASFSQPTGTLHLIRTCDLFRNVQWPQFDRADFMGRFVGAPVVWQTYDAPAFSNRVAVAGIMAGAASHQPYLVSNQLIPGALGDHLTSYGGVIHGVAGQMPILDWLDAGASASWGTVIEPCNYTNKFPTAELHAWYQRGFPAGEAYAMAISHPYQGLAAGDPLCAPYARPLMVAVSGLSPGSTVTGLVTVTAQASSSVPGRRVQSMDWYVDDLWQHASPPTPPTPGNELMAGLGGTNFTYTVQAGDDLFSAAAGLAAVIDASPHFQAEAQADQVVIRQAVAGIPGSSLSVTAATFIGSGAALTTSLYSPTNHLVESRYRAREFLFIIGTPVAGSSRIQLDLTRLDGTVVSREVIAQPGENRYSLLFRLMDEANDDPLFNHLDGAIFIYPEDYPSANATAGYLFSNDRTWRAANLRYHWRVSGAGLTAMDESGRVDDNADVLTGRATLFVEAGDVLHTRSHTLDTTTLPDGPHTLRALAGEGTAVATPGERVVAFTVDNHDLSCALAWPQPGAWILQGSLVTGMVQHAGSAPLAETRLWAEGKDQGSTLIWDSSTFGPGSIRLQARVRDTLNRQAWSEWVPVTVLADSDRDGLADEWETLRFGDLSATPTGDADADGQSNRNEFIADTLPQSASSLLRVEIERLANGQRRLLFPSSSMRRYQVQTRDLVPWSLPGPWTPVFPVDATGVDGNFLWTDDGTALPNADWRLYRVRARLP